MLKRKQDGYIELPLPDNSLAFFQFIKKASEEYWTETTINKVIYGFQVQQRTEWNGGLTEAEIQQFENSIGLKFPEPLKNFYRVMNGLNKPGVNVFGNSGHSHTYSPLFYSFPDDLPIIRDKILWIYEAVNVDVDHLKREHISQIFPIFSHRFMLIDIPTNPILSMYGNDIIYWSDNLSKLLAIEIFENIHNVWDFESNPNAIEHDIKFWLEFN